jgi:putative amide transporter protein
MLTGLMLLYVGATLGINGIWLIGQARAARLTNNKVPETATEAASQQAAASAVARRQASASAVASGDAGTVVLERVVPPKGRSVEEHFTFLQPKEVAIINFFTAGVGVFAATLSMIIGGLHNNLGDVANAAGIMLFAFTYMFLGINQFLNAGNRVFGWFCLFIAITAMPTGIYTLNNADGNVALLWLGTNWLVWSFLWFCFFLLLTLELPIMRWTGWATVAVAVATCWAWGFTVLQGVITLPI